MSTTGFDATCRNLPLATSSIAKRVAYQPLTTGQTRNTLRALLACGHSAEDELAPKPLCKTGGWKEERVKRLA